MSEEKTFKQDHYDILPEEINLHEVHDYDHEGLAKDVGGKVMRLTDRHDVGAKTTRSSFPTGKGAGVPTLKSFDASKKHKDITVPQGAKVVVTKKHVYGYHPQHGHWQAQRDDFYSGHFREEMQEIGESMASDTLKPNSRSAGSDPKSKIEAITSVIGAMHSMRKDDLTKWFTQAMALIGKEADSLPSGASADSNASSIDAKTGKGPKTRDAMPKISVKEDVEEMFAGQDLSEEFKDKASTLFEAAVNARVTLELSRLDEEYESRLEEEVNEIAEALEKKLDTYLDYVVENWMKENEVAIESSLRNEIMEEFINGLKGLFVEHYIDVPEEKIDVVEELAAKVDQLETMLDESITENAELKGMVSESTRISVLEEMSEDLTMVQSEKFAALAEGIDFDGDVGSYKKKLSYVKETYFSKKSTPTTNIEEETFEGDTSINESVKSHDPEINRLANAISRTIKK